MVRLLRERLPPAARGLRQLDAAGPLSLAELDRRLQASGTYWRRHAAERELAILQPRLADGGRRARRRRPAVAAMGLHRAAGGHAFPSGEGSIRARGPGPQAAEHKGGLGGFPRRRICRLRSPEPGEQTRRGARSRAADARNFRRDGEIVGGGPSAHTGPEGRPRCAARRSRRRHRFLRPGERDPRSSTTSRRRCSRTRPTFWPRRCAEWWRT